MLSKTWLSNFSPEQNLEGYTFLSSPRVLGRGGSVGIYVHSSFKFIIKDKSSNHDKHEHNIDYLLIQLIDNLDISFVCMYYPPNTKTVDIVSVIEHMKLLIIPMYFLNIWLRFQY